MKTVLLVEDDPELRERTRSAIERARPGLDLVTAASAGEALGVLAACAPDVVVLDDSLPDAGALDVLARIAGTEEKTPVIVVAEEGEIGRAVEAMKLGASDYVVKGTGHLSALPAAIDRALEKAALHARSLERLVRSERLQGLGEMAAGVAHDFNNLLTAILGRAQMLKMLSSDPEVLRSVAVIEQAALDGAGTVRRIQQLARDRDDLDLAPVRVDRLVRDTLERTRPKIEGSLVEAVLELGSPGAVLGDPSELRQVLTNLIHNAIDAMPGGGRLTIRSGASGPEVWLEIEDTGHGMDAETRDRMFHPFFTTKGTRGTGLGLSVSSSIVDRHGGEIEVASEVGKGTRIRVRLPAHVPETDDPPERPLAPAIRASARILVIDDDAAVRDVLADILRTGDHRVVVAGTGAEGLELFRRSGFDLVFTDLGMPGMNGWDVAAGIKSLSPRTPVGLITGWGASVDDGRLKDRGVDLIVPKPFRYRQVLELVAEAMELSKRAGG